MKKIIAILILALLIPSVSAQDEEQLVGITPEAGITPDSIFYGLDVFFDNVRATLTPSSLGKAKVRLNIIQERMAEMEEMADKNKTTEAKKAELEGQKQMEKFERSIKGIDAKDAPELNESIQIHTATLEIFKQRLMNNDNPDDDDAIAGMLRTLETSSNVIANIPATFESLIAECIEAGESPEECALVEDFCKEMGATTADECKEMIATTAVIRSCAVGESCDSRPTGPLDCDGGIGMYSDGKTRWCCDDSDGTYSPSYIEHILRLHPGPPGSTPAPMDNYYYRKGTVEYKIINLKTGEVEEGVERDSCDGDTLTEWICPTSLNRVTRNERYSEEYDCPYGCQDGACIKEVIEEEVPEEVEVAEEEFEGECTDSDGGLDYYEFGICTKTMPDGNVQTHEDKCDGGHLHERYCQQDGCASKAPAYLCPNGCQDGACINETVEPTPEPEPPEEECSDSDGGINYYTAGETCAGGECKDDKCTIKVSSDTYNDVTACSGDDCYLFEYACNGSIFWADIYNCPNGCQDGACLPAPSSVGCGILSIDGVLCPGEWDSAVTMSFVVNVPEGGTTPATLFVMNDASNLYLALRFERSVVDPGNSLSFEFDNDNDGQAEEGDDVMLFNPSVGLGFIDDFGTNNPPCPAGSGEASCGFEDIDHGGSNDGAGAFLNDGTYSVYEMSHPLDSDDDLHDFSLTAGQTVGFYLSLRMIQQDANYPEGFGDTKYPGFRNYAQITIKSQ